MTIEDVGTIIGVTILIGSLLLVCYFGWARDIAKDKLREIRTEACEKGYAEWVVVDLSRGKTEFKWVKNKQE